MHPIKINYASSQTTYAALYNYLYIIITFNILVSYEILRIHLHFVQQLQLCSITKKILQQNSAGCSSILHNSIAAVELVTQEILIIVFCKLQNLLFAVEWKKNEPQQFISLCS